MPKRKLRGKLRQQVRWAIDDETLWDDDLLTYDGLDYSPIDKNPEVPERRPKKKFRSRQRSDYDYESINY